MSDAAPRLMLKREYAAHRKVSPPMVSHWIKNGRIAIVDGKVDVEASDAMLAQSLDPARGGVGGHDVIRDGRLGRPPSVAPAGPLPDIVAANVDDKRLSSDLKRLRLKRESGELIDAAAAVETVGLAYGEVRQCFSGLAAQIGARLAADFGADARKVIAAVDEETRKAAAALHEKLGDLAPA